MVSQPLSLPRGGKLQFEVAIVQYELQSPLVHDFAITPEPLQARLQAPQCNVSVSVFTSQPVVGALSQSPQP